MNRLFGGRILNVKKIQHLFNVGFLPWEFLLLWLYNSNDDDNDNDLYDDDNDEDDDDVMM